MKTTVLIAGAGPVGMSAALALSSAGISVRIVERGAAIEQRMRASTFHPPTLDMLDELSVGTALIKKGLKVSSWQMRHHDSGASVVFDLQDIAADTNHPYRLQVEQHHYCELAAGALEANGVGIEFETGVQGVRQDTDSVSVDLANGETATCRWLIAADGAKSTIRSQLGLNYGGKTYTHSSLLLSTNFKFQQVLDNLSDVTYCWSARGPFSLLRLRQCWRVSLYPGEEVLAAGEHETRIRHWLRYIDPAAEGADIQDVNPYRVHERCVDQFRVGNIFFAGDAAHLNPPSGGMGMNGGIHDAMNLSAKMLAVLDGQDDALLNRYHIERHALVSETIIPQAAANRSRMATHDVALQKERLKSMTKIAHDDKARYDFLLQSSMISGLRKAAAFA